MASAVMTRASPIGCSQAALRVAYKRTQQLRLLPATRLYAAGLNDGQSLSDNAHQPLASPHSSTMSSTTPRQGRNERSRSIMRRHFTTRAEGGNGSARGRGKGKGKEEEEGGQYKASVCLPQTTFGMRANASVRELEIHKLWEDLQVQQRLREASTEGTFTLHDGPPYANGDLHIGHALNKILKDIINRYKILNGYSVSFIPGWDCHGLPIELKVLQSLSSSERKDLTPISLRQKAMQFALDTVDKQRESFKRFGVWGEWDAPYLTLQPAYEAAQLRVFAAMFHAGHIYRGKKPVHWSPSSRTALAEAELEYPEGHVSRSVYAAFPLCQLSESMPAEVAQHLGSAALAIWTTTPWTLPGNAAVAVNDRIQYSLVEVLPAPETPPSEAASSSPPSPSDSTSSKKKGKASGGGGSGKVEDSAATEAKGPTFGKGARNTGALLSALQGAEAAGGSESEGVTVVRRHLIVASDLVESLAAKWRCRLTTVATFPGSSLQDCWYEHPLYDRKCPVVVGGDYITTESGTGLVHTAPGHGQEDYQTGLRCGLPLISPVDDAGRFTEDAGEEFVGQNVLGEGNVAVMQSLDRKAALLLEEAYEHKYPYDWRSKKPTIFRATEQWFASVDGFKAAALEAIRSVEWIPAQGEKRISAMTEGRSDWCISRQRSWGVPIPAFFHIETGEALLTEESIEHVCALVEKHGSDAWFTLSVEELLPESHRSEADNYRKGTDTMDVWFDSGSSWSAVLQQRQGVSLPADLYLEGSDQHRGWFQSSLLTSVAATGKPPYSSVLTHGFVLDERGRKMSKSMGNVIDPAAVINGGKNQKTEPAYGADVLRLWVASVDYSNDVTIGPTILKQIADVYRKLRGTLRYLLGNLHGWEPSMAVPYSSLPEVDRYALHRLAEFITEVKESYEAFQFFRFYQSVQRFAVVDLSNFYFDICKDRLYVGGEDHPTRRACQTVLASHLTALLAAMAPVLPHTAEDAWQNVSPAVRQLAGGDGIQGEGGAGAAESVFGVRWPAVKEEWRGMSEEKVKLWKSLIELRTEVNKVMEQARGEKLIGANLDACVYLCLDNLSDQQLRESLQVMACEQEEIGGERNGGDQGNRVDSLKTVFLSSQAKVVDAASFDSLSPPFTSEVQLADTSASVRIGVARAIGDKCERCWHFSPLVGSFKDHATLCPRCNSVVGPAVVLTA